MNKEDVMNKKRYTVKWIALLMQAACLFFVFSGASYAKPDPFFVFSGASYAKPDPYSHCTTAHTKACHKCTNTCRA